MHIITNGFKGSTEKKLHNSQLKPYFSQTITSECIGVTKPNSQIFHYAVEKAKTTMNKSLMIGDNIETDIRGALNSGMDRVYYNPARREYDIEVQHEIEDLIDLKSLL